MVRGDVSALRISRSDSRRRVLYRSSASARRKSGSVQAPYVGSQDRDPVRRKICNEDGAGRIFQVTKSRAEVGVNPGGTDEMFRISDLDCRKVSRQGEVRGLA